ncbi:MAG TPA: hypothetical protein VK470_06725 [Bacteroidota bacterium]|nr:hypothetical protein [Bacteroidota bacterium]
MSGCSAGSTQTAVLLCLPFGQHADHRTSLSVLLGEQADELITFIAIKHKKRVCDTYA